MDSVEAWKSVPRRGVEIGGLLLGRIAAGGQTITIEDFTPVECEHRSGPFYRLSENDRKRFDETFRAHTHAVGIYRTQTRAECLSLDEDDASLFEQYFHGKEGVFLLVQPATSRAAFFARQEGALALAHELPFHPADLPAEAPRKVGQAVSPAKPAKPRARPFAEHWRGLANRLPHQLGRRWMMPVGSAMLGMLAAATLFHFRTQPERPQVVVAARPFLSVEREGTALRLRWERTSPTVRSASHGTLYITDGSHQSRMDLSPHALDLGSLSYWPESGDVTFRLELAGPNRTLSDSIRFVSQPAPKSAVKTAQAASPPSVATAQPKRPPPHLTAPKTSRNTYGQANHTHEQAASRMEEPEPYPASAGSASARETPASNAPLDRPKVETPSPHNPPRSLPATRAPTVSVSAEPAPGSRWERLVRRIPLVRRFKKQPQSFEPPHATHEVHPALSERERAELIAPVPVDVKVYVAESGKVEYAELLSGGQFRDLAAEAVYAARRWAFSPARVGEESVPSEVILHFRFEPAGK